MSEEWRDVVGYEGLYQVCDAGRVRSMPRVVRRWAAKATLPGRTLSPWLDNHGRPSVKLSRNRRKKGYRISRLVCEAFHGPCPPGMECCHNNGNHADNRADNLRWDTRSANQMDRVKHGTSNRGERHGRSVLTSCEVVAIKKSLADGVRQCRLARAFAVSPTTIRLIKIDRTWRHINV